MTVQEYMAQVPEERQEAFTKLRTTIAENIPKGFKECINYKMPSYVVPHKLYPGGYHCSPELPLPFASIANQKGFIALYHMGVYANPELLEWFVAEYPKHSKYKLNMGKSCIRFKRMDDIPFDLIATLMSKMSVDDWITLYEQNVKS